MNIIMSIQFECGLPDDWHHHLRDSYDKGDGRLELVAEHVSSHFHRVIVMPNIIPPITTCKKALEYRERILAAVPQMYKETFNPLMTLYLTDTTSIDEIILMHTDYKDIIVAVKMYPFGVTTNSHFGVTCIDNIIPVLQCMQELKIPLLIHGEVVDKEIDIFDREAIFIKSVLKPLLLKLPALRIVLEHITTKEAVDFVLESGSNIAATITPQHLLLDRNALFSEGLQPHYYCLPILKRRNPHRLALLGALKSEKFFIGTDSAPHIKIQKETCGCAGCYTAPHALELYAEAFEEAGALEYFETFVCKNGPKFYCLPENPLGIKIIMKRVPYVIPDNFIIKNTSDTIIPLKAGQTLNWSFAGFVMTS